MKKIIIQNLVIPTYEVMAKVVSNPSIKAVTENNWWQISAMIVAPLLAALLTYWLTIKGMKKNEEGKRRIQESDIKLALKYEVFNNAYQIIDMKRVAEETRGAMKETNKTPSLIYLEVGYVSFNSIIRNNLVSCLGKDAERLFQLYSLLREYDLAIKRFIAEIESAPKITTNSEAYRGIIDENLEKIIIWTSSLDEKCIKVFEKMSFLNLVEWNKFKDVYLELN